MKVDNERLLLNLMIVRHVFCRLQDILSSVNENLKLINLTFKSYF